MNLFHKWGALLFGLWIQVSSVPAIHGRDGNINNVSQEGRPYGWFIWFD